ncbi:MAG TPA: class I SAM-dependent methyltransferase, partial [Clostridia bacterium]|nr:class I SAM-dependent methyltransferase [Clostridia bacterium]
AMLCASFPDFQGKRVLVPSSGDNAAVFAFHLLGAKVTSADIAERQLDNAKKIADARGWDIDFVHDDSMKLEQIESGAYDLVYTSNGVHVWIDDLAAMYRNFHRVLKLDGRYVMFEVHPFNRPFTQDECDPYRIASAKPYEETGPHFDIPNYHWRVQDLFNAMVGAGFSIHKIVEFHSQIDCHSCWWYQSPEQAQADENRLSDWTRNPFAALPQWIEFSARKDAPGR